MFVSSLDHLVLTVRDRQATVNFYTQVLGMQLRSFGDGREALHFGLQKFNLHELLRPVDANVRHATPGSADLCLLLNLPLEEMERRLAEHGVPVIAGPVVRNGAQGEIRSLYVYDPDENLIELAEPVAGGMFEGGEGNRSFHRIYQQRLQDWLRDPGRPICLVVQDTAVFLHQGQRQQVALRPPSFHAFKAEIHSQVAAVMAGAENQGFAAALERGARMELEDLHATVFPWWSALTIEERRRCGIVLTTPHQPRAGRLSVLYFERLTGRRTGLGASLDDGLVVLEYDCDEHTALLALARHYLDQEIGEQFFGDRFRMQRDVLADSAQTVLDQLLGDFLVQAAHDQVGDGNQAGHHGRAGPAGDAQLGL